MGILSGTSDNLVLPQVSGADPVVRRGGQLSQSPPGPEEQRRDVHKPDPGFEAATPRAIGEGPLPL